MERSHRQKDVIQSKSKISGDLFAYSPRCISNRSYLFVILVLHQYLKYIINTHYARNFHKHMDFHDQSKTKTKSAADMFQLGLMYKIAMVSAFKQPVKYIYTLLCD